MPEKNELPLITEQGLAERQLTIQQDSLQELKLFNSNIAMKIGDAVRTAIQSSNDGITEKLDLIADKFAHFLQVLAREPAKLSATR